MILKFFYRLKRKKIDLVIIGPEAPLVEGIAQKIRESGIAVFGPNADGAMLEASKNFLKEIMNAAEIPTADLSILQQQKKLTNLSNDMSMGWYCIERWMDLQLVKSVVVCDNKEQALEAIQSLVENNAFKS